MSYDASKERHVGYTPWNSSHACIETYTIIFSLSRIRLSLCCIGFFCLNFKSDNNLSYYIITSYPSSCYLFYRNRHNSFRICLHNGMYYYIFCLLLDHKKSHQIISQPSRDAASNVAMFVWGGATLLIWQVFHSPSVWNIQAAAWWYTPIFKMNALLWFNRINFYIDFLLF